MEKEGKFLSLIFLMGFICMICTSAIHLDFELDPQSTFPPGAKERGEPYHDIFEGKYVDPDDDILRDKRSSESDSSQDVNRNNDPDRSND